VPSFAPQGGPPVPPATSRPSGPIFPGVRPEGTPIKDGWDAAERGFGSLSGLGTSLMAITNPDGAKALVAQNKLNQEKDQGQWTVSVDAEGRIIRVNNKTGQVEAVGSGSSKKMDAGALKHLNEEMGKYSFIHTLKQDAADILDDIRGGKLNLGLYNNFVNQGRNLAGVTNEQSAALDRYDRFIKTLSNEQLLAAKGVQTEGDAYRALQQFTGVAGRYNNDIAKQALENVLKSGSSTSANARALLDSYRGQYGADNAALAPFTRAQDQREDFYRKQNDRLTQDREQARKPKADTKARPGLDTFYR
jgi:hypothetical protein